MNLSMKKIYKNLKTTFYVMVMLCLVPPTHAFQINKDSLKIQQIVKQLRKQNKSAQLLQTNNPEDVKFLKQYIWQKNKIISTEKELKNISDSNRLGNRYKNGDATSISEIVQLIEEKDKKLIRELFNDLRLEFSEANKSLSLDMRIKESLFRLIEDPDFENAVVQFLGYNQVEGSLDVFEKRLMSGNSNEEDRLFFWLAREGKREKPLAFALNKIKNYEEGVTETYWTKIGLDYYLEKGSEKIRSKIVAAAQSYIESNPLTTEELNSVYGDNLFSNKDFKLGLYELLLKYGNESTLPFLENLKTEILNNEDLNDEDKTTIITEFEIQLFRFKTFEEQKVILLNLLKLKDHFLKATSLVMSHKQLVNDKDLVYEMFYGITKLRFENYQKELFFEAVSELDSQTFIKYLDQIELHPNYRNNFISHYKSFIETLEEKNTYLLELGLIDEPVSVEKINAYKNSEDYKYDKNSIFASLKIANISFGYDAEPNIIPVDYDTLLQGYIDISRGKLNNINYLLETKVDPENYEVAYQFFCPNR